MNQELIKREIAQDTVRTAQEHERKERLRHIEEQRSFRTETAEVFWRIFIAAPAILSLSITFIGFLVAKNQWTIIAFRLLGVAWALLIASMITAMLRNYIAPLTTVTGTVIMFGRTKLSRLLAEKALLGSGNMVLDRATGERVTTASEKHREGIKKTEGELRKLEPREKTLISARNWLEYISLISFTVGVILLTCFAYLNLYSVTGPTLT